MAKNILRRIFDAIPYLNSTVRDNNKSFDTFVDLEKSNDIVEEESIIQQYADSSQSKLQFEAINTYKKMVYGSLSSDKPQRLLFFRNMINFPEVGDAVDEICDACINFDDNMNFVNIHFRNEKTTITEEQQTEIKHEFENFISLFDFENRGFDLFRSLVVDGELAFENIISKDDTTDGIIGVKRILPECYEILVDVSYQTVGVLLNAALIVGDRQDKEKPTKQFGGDSRLGSIHGNYMARNPEAALIPMPKKQITLIDTGIYNTDKSVVYPILERARRAYRQLSLIEDAVIIYRLVRAPERLVFNVDTGKLPPSKAEQMVKKMMGKYQTKKVYDPINGTVTNDYDSHQMLESYWFPKPEGSQGTSVETLGTGASLGELDDLQYFLRKLYLSLKIPFNRFEGEGNQKEDGESITYEEYRFAKFIMRIQARMSTGLMESFITHLQLTGLWDKFKLNNRNFYIKFNPPTAFELYETQKLLAIKMENYKLISDEEDFSNDLAKKKYLGMTEKDIQMNIEAVEREKIRDAMLERKIQNVADHGDPSEIVQDESSGTNSSKGW